MEYSEVDLEEKQSNLSVEYVEKYRFQRKAAN